jgi:hypothetical protein
MVVVGTETQTVSGTVTMFDCGIVKTELDETYDGTSKVLITTTLDCDGIVTYFDDGKFETAVNGTITGV